METKENCLENTYVTNMYAFGMAKIRLRIDKRRPSTHYSPLSSSTVRSSHNRFQEVELQKCINWNLNEWINVCEALTKCNCQLWLVASRENYGEMGARTLRNRNQSFNGNGWAVQATRTLQSIHQSINFNGIVKKISLQPGRPWGSRMAMELTPSSQHIYVSDEQYVWMHCAPKVNICEKIGKK